MKTAISIPDDTFERAQRAAAREGVNRSQLYVTALERYLADLDAQGVTDAVDRVVDLVAGDASSRIAVELGRGVLDDGEDW